MKTVGFIIVALALLPASLGAEPSKTPIKLALAAYGTASLVDTLSTVKALTSGRGREANPLFRQFENQPVLLGVVRLAGSAVLGYALYKAAEKHPTLAAVMTWIAAGSVSAIAISNMRAGRR